MHANAESEVRVMEVRIGIDDEELRTIESGLNRLREILEEADNIMMRIRHTTYFNLNAEMSAGDAVTSPTE